jgi:hypothetical protein
MENNCACYDMLKWSQAVEMVKAVKWSVSRKNQHFAKCMEIEKVFQFAAENLNWFLFNPEYELKTYRNMAYNFKAFKAETLNSELNRVKRFIYNELNDIRAMVENQEVDSINYFLD